ncbi:MAG: EamA family transporter [Acetobacteraceae bacterium]
MPSAVRRASPLADNLPPHGWFVVSAVFHYLGRSFAVLLFASLPPTAVAWLRIATSGCISALWRRPWRAYAALPRRDRRIVAALGIDLAFMNIVFYEAIARLPLALVGAIEFLGPIAIAASGVRTGRNLAALMFAVAGVGVLTDARLAGQPVGYLFAFANCVLFAFYIVLGHRISSGGGGISGVDRLAAAMLFASVAALPFGFRGAWPAFSDPLLLGAAAGVGISSSVIPYVCDQLAMRRLPRSSFALLLALLPACAVLIGTLVLRQIPGPIEALGILLVIAGVALHQAEPRSLNGRT